MASKDGGQAFAPVLAAVATMQGNVPRTEKAQAHAFLEKFQKSVRSGENSRKIWWRFGALDLAILTCSLSAEN